MPDELSCGRMTREVLLERYAFLFSKEKIVKAKKTTEVRRQLKIRFFDLPGGWLAYQVRRQSEIPIDKSFSIFDSDWNIRIRFVSDSNREGNIPQTVHRQAERITLLLRATNNRQHQGFWDMRFLHCSSRTVKYRILDFIKRAIMEYLGEKREMVHIPNVAQLGVRCYEI